MADEVEVPGDDEPTTRRMHRKAQTRVLSLTDSGRQVVPEGEKFLEANLIVLAHPGNKLLGRRFRLPAGAQFEIGRDALCDISLPDVDSISRHHALLKHLGHVVTLEDCRSTNGTWLRDKRVEEPTHLTSGDRFQVGAVHFKFLHDEDVEHAYHEAIYELAVRDGLTGLFNRRKFQEDAERECGRAARYSRPLAVVLFDIDHFKRVNDNYGHLRGDAVLTRIAGQLRATLRREQFVARIGGEEFALLCEETDAPGAQRLAERLREEIAALVHPDGAGGFNVTCSFGVAAFTPPMEALAHLMAAADRAMYRAKQGGRNRVVVDGAPDSPQP